ncbi:MAG: hypothetical protein WD005_03935 [Haliea sp.]
MSSKYDPTLYYNPAYQKEFKFQDIACEKAAIFNATLAAFVLIVVMLALYFFSVPPMWGLMVLFSASVAMAIYLQSMLLSAISVRQAVLLHAVLRMAGDSNSGFIHSSHDENHDSSHFGHIS